MGTIVFLHDSFGCIELWRGFPEEVISATGWNGLIYDRRGYGKSSPAEPASRQPNYMQREAELLPTILDRFEIERAVLFGHSDGGTIALLAAALFPERIEAVVSEAAHVFVEEIGLQAIRRAVFQYENGNLKHRLERYHAVKTEWVFRAWADTWLSPEFRDWNIERVLPSVRCPVLIIQGERDEYGTLAQVKSIEGGIGGRAKSLVLPGVGHSPHKEAGGVVVEAVRRFLADSDLTHIAQPH